MHSPPDNGRGHKLDQPFAERIAERELWSEQSLIQKVTLIFQFGLSESVEFESTAERFAER